MAEETSKDKRLPEQKPEKPTPEKVTPKKVYRYTTQFPVR